MFLRLLVSSNSWGSNCLEQQTVWICTCGKLLGFCFRTFILFFNISRDHVVFCLFFHSHTVWSVGFCGQIRVPVLLAQSFWIHANNWERETVRTLSWFVNWCLRGGGKAVRHGPFLGGSGLHGHLAKFLHSASSLCLFTVEDKDGHISLVWSCFEWPRRDTLQKVLHIFQGRMCSYGILFAEISFEEVPGIGLGTAGIVGILQGPFYSLRRCLITQGLPSTFGTYTSCEHGSWRWEGNHTNGDDRVLVF